MLENKRIEESKKRVEQALVSPRTLFLDAIKNRRFLRFGCSRNNSSF